MPKTGGLFNELQLARYIEYSIILHDHTFYALVAMWLVGSDVHHIWCMCDNIILDGSHTTVLFCDKIKKVQQLYILFMLE